MRLKSILAKDPGQNTQLTRQYQYSPAGNITGKQTGHGSYAYQYYKLYRLIHAENPTQNDESYTYDLLGNRLTSSSTTGTWNYNANNELLGYDTISFSYDADGNTIQKNDNGIITEYSYEIEDHLVEVTTNNPQPTTYRYHYDPFGRRLWKEVDGTRTYFVYSDEGLVGEYDAAGQEIRTYGWIPGSWWSTDPLFVKIEGVYYWYRNDLLGTPQKIVTTSGAVVWEAVYDSFGNCQIQVETITNNLRFPGQYYDSETGLCYNLNRYYDPTTGRYLRADPFGASLNLYVYCFNNPLGLIDTTGLCAIRFVGGMVKGAARAAFQMFVYQPLAMAYDPEQIAYALISGDLGSFTPYSDIGLAAVNGAGTTDILVGMVKGIGYVPVEFVQAIASGDPERIGAATFNAGLLAYGAYKAIGGIRGAVEARLGGISESVGQGKTVLGHYPEYIELAERLGARRFNVPESVWNKMSEAEHWTANQKFLDRMISRGDEIILATPLDEVRPGSYFARELEYLGNKGYVPSADGTRLIKEVTP